MTSFAFSVDQVRAAPPEVRRWIEREVTAALAVLSRLEHDPSQLHTAALAACTPPEAAEVYELIKGNFLLSQVFFELGREVPGSRGEAPLHALRLADMLRHTRLADGDRLVDCFTAINQAFQTIHNDPETSLFGFDQYGHVWIHPTTHDSIRELWEQMFHRQPPTVAGAGNTAAGPVHAGFTPPHLGPSEELAQHTPDAAIANF
jgi:hypothetical protein